MRPSLQVALAGVLCAFLVATPTATGVTRGMMTVSLTSLTITAPFSGGSTTSLFGGAGGCSASYLQSGTPSFVGSTGVARISQKALASNQHGCSGTNTVGIANGTVDAGAAGVPFKVAFTGSYSVDVEWKVSWTLNASAHSRYAPGPADECTWWGLTALVYNTAGTTSITSSGFVGAWHNPTCLGGNATWSQHQTGTFHVYVNGTLGTGTYYVETQVYIVSGAYVQDPGLAYGYEDLQYGPDFARLLSITVS